MLLFKDDANTKTSEHPNRLQAVYRVSCEAGKGFCNDEVDFPFSASVDHAVKGCSISAAGSTDALVGVNAYQLPIWARCNVLRVIGFLRVVAVDLFETVCADPAIGGNSLTACCAASAGLCWLLCWDNGDILIHGRTSFPTN